jgi:hypothetical protein
MRFAKHWVVFALLGLMPNLFGCIDDLFDERESEIPRVGTRSGTLTRAQTCDDLLARIQADAVARIDQAAEDLRDPELGRHDSDGLEAGRQAPGAIGAVPMTSATPAASGAPIPPSAGMAGQPSAPAPAREAPRPEPGDATEEVPAISDTNRQVAEVDEADIVKVDRDGEHLYLLHGDRLVVMRVQPADETELESKLSHVFDGEFDGRPYEMFVENGRVVVFSAVRQGSALDEGSGEPRNQPALPTTMRCAGCYDDASDYRFTKLTFLDMRSGRPEVERELIIEGQYVSSRRHGAIVRAVLSGGFKAPEQFDGTIDYEDAWGQPYSQELIDEQVDAWRERAADSVLHTDLDAWLPVERELEDGELQSVPRRCDEFFVPSPGRTAYGLTHVLSTDLGDPGQELGGVYVLGGASVVYSNADTMVIGHEELGETRGGSATMLHSFALDGPQTDYVASGAVAGRVLNQFALDEQGGVIRVATVEERWDERGTFTTDNRVRTLRADDGELEIQDQTPNLGKPRETIRSVRYVGDRAYVVTFERTDPLVVVDLARPESLRVLGSVEIPGFSTYMHPLGDGHLLTIGEYVDPQTGSNRVLQLRVFDVTDPLDPRDAHRYEFPLGGSSKAQSDHKAFNFFSERKLLAFPYVDPSRARTSLQVFRVDADSGFDFLGSVEHQALAANCLGTQPGDLADDAVFWGCPDPSVRRGVFIEDHVYSISYGGVLVHEVAELARRSGPHDAVARVDLPAPSHGDWLGSGNAGQPGIARPAPPPVSLPPAPVPPAPPSDVDGGVESSDDAVEFCARYDAICGYGSGGFADEEDCVDDFGSKFDAARRTCVLESLDDAAADASWCSAAAGNVECGR